MSNFSLPFFRNHGVVWILLVIFFFSCVPSVTLAQQPTATISALSGMVLVNGQAGNTGIVLSAGDVIETQAGASLVLVFSDGSQLKLGEKTKVDMTVLSETATGARVSRIKLMWGWVRAKLSSNHQHVGSSFDIETPNALVGVKFSQPDVEVRYDPAKQETIGIAHTAELMAKNLLTDEEKIVPVGSTVIITAVTIKILAGTTVVGATSTGMSTGTKVALGVGAAAAAGGVAALATGSEERCETAECTGVIAGEWFLSGSCVAQGCTENTYCMSTPPYLCGIDVCTICEASGPITLNQSGNILSGYAGPDEAGQTTTITGVVNGDSVSFTTPGFGIPVGDPSHTTTFTGVLDGNTIQGELFGSVSWNVVDDGNVIGRETATWDGSFTMTRQNNEE